MTESKTGSKGTSGGGGSARVGNSTVRISARNITRVKAPAFKFASNRNSNARAYGSASRAGARAKGGVKAAAKFQLSNTIAAKSAKGTSRSPNQSFQGISRAKLRSGSGVKRAVKLNKMGEFPKPMTRQRNTATKRKAIADFLKRRALNASGIKPTKFKKYVAGDLLLHTQKSS
jgi:hypothetical protein